MSGVLAPGKTEVERMAWMTDLAMAAAGSNPVAFQEPFEEIGMNIEDPTLFSEPALARYYGSIQNGPSVLHESLTIGVNDAVSEPGLIRGEAPSLADDGKKGPLVVDGAWVVSIKSLLGAQTVTLCFPSKAADSPVRWTANWAPASFQTGLSLAIH